VALDIKYKDVEAMPDGFIDVCFFNGAIRTEEQEHLAKLLRKKAKVLVAFGACSHTGGVPGLANLADREEVFARAYLESPSTENPQRVVPKTSTRVPEGELRLPEFYDRVKTLDQTVEVDYYLPGCPPPPSLILKAVEAIAKGELPPKGSVLAPLKSVCDECPRNKTKPEKLSIPEVKRPYEVQLDPEKCFLAQGIICMGPATRGGMRGQVRQRQHALHRLPWPLPQRGGPGGGHDKRPLLHPWGGGGEGGGLRPPEAGG
jgi:F420-non-reducing hydrogenase small subunit